MLRQGNRPKRTKRKTQIKTPVGSACGPPTRSGCTMQSQRRKRTGDAIGSNSLSNGQEAKRPCHVSLNATCQFQKPGWEGREKRRNGYYPYPRKLEFQLFRNQERRQRGSDLRRRSVENPKSELSVSLLFCWLRLCLFVMDRMSRSIRDPLLAHCCLIQECPCLLNRTILYLEAVHFEIWNGRGFVAVDGMHMFFLELPLPSCTPVLPHSLCDSEAGSSFGWTARLALQRQCSDFMTWPDHVPWSHLNLGVH